MARKVLVRLVDDLDGVAGEDVTTITFGLDGVTYEIDLNESNATSLRDRLAEFVSAARKTGGRVRRGGRPGVARSSGDAAAIREWAREQGYTLGDRGRIPANIIDEYQAAQRGGAVKAAAAAKPTQAKATARAGARSAKATGKAARPAARTRKAATTKSSARGRRPKSS